MQFTTHASAERLINQLVLLDPRFPLESWGDDFGVVVIAVACQVIDHHISARKSLDNQSLDFICRHRHRVVTIPLLPYLSADM